MHKMTHNEPTTVGLNTLGLTVDPPGGQINLPLKPRRKPVYGAGIVWGFIGGSIIWTFAILTVFTVYRAARSLGWV